MKKLFLPSAFALVFLFETLTASALSCTTLTKPLSLGSKDKEVLPLQQFLYDSKYLTTLPNGYFGAGTVSALKAFQKKNNLVVNGFVGPAARGKIKEMSCSSTASSTVTSLNKGTAAPTPLVIDTKKTVTTTTAKKLFEYGSGTYFNLKNDLTKLYAQYWSQDITVEPAKSNFTKEFDAIFKTYFNISNVTNEHPDILGYPEVSLLINKIKEDYPNKSETDKSQNGVTISGMNMTSASAFDPTKYIRTPLTFKISDDSTITKVCRRYYEFHTLHHAPSVNDEWCVPYTGTNGVYSDPKFFSYHTQITMPVSLNGKSVVMWDDNKIDYAVFDFYVVDTNGKKSNHLKFTFTK